MKWINDDGYSGCKTARRGELAFVICPPELGDDGWGFQVFDESDEWAMERGERADEGYGFRSEDSVMRYGEFYLMS